MIKKLLDAVSLAAKAKPTDIPLFPLGSVLFPDGILALKIFEPRYMDMAKVCLKNETPFGICLIREGAEVGVPAVPEPVGTMARIVEWDMEQLGVLQVRVAGSSRFRIGARRVTDAGLIIAESTPHGEDSNEPCPEFAPCRDFLEKVLAQIGAAKFHGPIRLDDQSWVSFRITEILPITQTIKQKMLELTDSRMRLEILHRVLLDQKLIDRPAG